MPNAHYKHNKHTSSVSLPNQTRHKGLQYRFDPVSCVYVCGRDENERCRRCERKNEWNEGEREKVNKKDQIKRWMHAAPQLWRFTLEYWALLVMSENNTEIVYFLYQGLKKNDFLFESIAKIVVNIWFHQIFHLKPSKTISNSTI